MQRLSRICPELSPRPVLSGGVRFAVASVFAVASALTTGGIAAAQDKPIELKISHYVPPSHSIHKEFERWGEELSKKSGGRLTVKIFPAGQMGPVNRQYDLARTGVADIAWVLNGALPGRFPLTELAQLPYVFTPAGSTTGKPVSISEASAIVTGMREQLESDYKGTRLLYLTVQPTMGLHFNKAAVRTPADLKGLRVRHNGPLPAKMLEAWGATPAAVAPVELADALAKGTIDGATLNFEFLQAFKLAGSINKVTDIDAYAVTLATVMNEAKYKSLPDDLRKLIDESTGVEGARRVGELFEAAEESGRKYMLENKAEIIEPTAEQRRAFADAVKPLTEETLKAVEGKGLPARKFHDALRAKVDAAK